MSPVSNFHMLDVEPGFIQTTQTHELLVSVYNLPQDHQRLRTHLGLARDIAGPLLIANVEVRKIHKAYTSERYWNQSSSSQIENTASRSAQIEWDEEVQLSDLK